MGEVGKSNLELDTRLKFFRFLVRSDDLKVMFPSKLVEFPVRLSISETLR